MNIRAIIENALSLKQQLLSDEHLVPMLEQSIATLTLCFRQQGKVMFCGNGGSAADAQHLAAEFSGRFYFDRPPLDAEALHVNTSYLTAVANDYSFDEVFARLVKGRGRKGDVLIALSTSGNSPNILRAIEEARIAGLFVIGFTGKQGGKMKGLCDLLLQAPSNDTPRIQEIHILLGHIICQGVEENLFPQYKPGR
ncbi:MAG: D-sedoheptulose 7-phosphate isomerase [Bacteroidales bacterium]|nr:D-sedoheptulose 7-phosphate isomerase [Bacteroidales bacterium]MDZ4205561.1 D-sedoheptulose 7-phosphate isomerase [Bacteroidales bacterium]